jgi:hypothetical protein
LSAFPGAVVVLPALWGGAVVGAIGGGTFGILMILAERGATGREPDRGVAERIPS